MLRGERAGRPVTSSAGASISRQRVELLIPVPDFFLGGRVDHRQHSLAVRIKPIRKSDRPAGGLGPSQPRARCLVSLSAPFGLFKNQEFWKPCRSQQYQHVAVCKRYDRNAINGVPPRNFAFISVTPGRSERMSAIQSPDPEADGSLSTGLNRGSLIWMAGMGDILIKSRYPRVTVQGQAVKLSLY